MARRRFEWDDEKRRLNLRRHGLDFIDVQRAFERPRIVDFDEVHSVEEDRYRMLGWLEGRVVVIIYTERRNRIRLISARPAEPEEALLYLREFFGEPYDDA